MPLTPTASGNATRFARTVLLVDSDHDSRLIYRMLLEHYGYHVLEAAVAEEGLRLARTDLPDVVVSEILLPLVDGYQFIRALRADERTAHIPLLIVSSAALLLAQSDQSPPGWNGYLRKPCAPGRVLAEVQRLISGETGSPSNRARSSDPREAHPPRANHPL